MLKRMRWGMLGQLCTGREQVCGWCEPWQAPAMVSKPDTRGRFFGRLQLRGRRISIGCWRLVDLALFAVITEPSDRITFLSAPASTSCCIVVTNNKACYTSKNIYSTIELVYCHENNMILGSKADPLEFLFQYSSSDTLSCIHQTQRRDIQNNANCLKEERIGILVEQSK